MSSTDQITFPCPQCHRPVQADTWQVLDLAKHPDLRQQLLQENLQSLHCPHCQALALPFAIHDPVGQQVIFYIPEHLPLPSEMIPQIQGHLGNALMLAFKRLHPDHKGNDTSNRKKVCLKKILSSK